MIKFNENSILAASLLGSKVLEQIPRFEKVENELMKHVLPPISFLPFLNTTQVKNPQFNEADVWEADKPLSEDQQFFPFSFEGDDGVRYLLPYEPLISINGKNTIIRRNVAKWKTSSGVALGGSIKERWNQADYEITITGALYGSIISGSIEDCFPRADFEKLRSFMTAPRALKVYSPPLELLGINRIVIESFSFPFSKGEDVQAYEIKAFSDFDHKLLLDIND
jgi:hypothetical protein